VYYNQLDTQEKALVEAQVSNNKKSLIVAYILLLFLGQVGAHRFYIKGVSIGAIGQLILGVLGWLTVWILIGYVFLFIVGVWVVIDLFLIPKMIREQAGALKEDFAKDILMTNQNMSDF